jgi:hypothetical protein
MKRRLVVIASGNGSNCRAGISTSYEIVMVSYGWTKEKTAIFLVYFHRIPPPKESMKAFLENRRLKRAYFFCRKLPQFLSNEAPSCGNSKR